MLLVIAVFDAAAASQEISQKGAGISHPNLIINRIGKACSSALPKRRQ